MILLIDSMFTKTNSTALVTRGNWAYRTCRTSAEYFPFLEKPVDAFDTLFPFLERPLIIGTAGGWSSPYFPFKCSQLANL